MEIVMFFQRIDEKFRVTGLCLIMLIILPGCFRSKILNYDIEMRVDRDQLVREVSAQGISKDEQKRIAILYPAKVDGKYVGQFYGDLPNDVGGAGSFNSFKTKMGSMFVYLERFRGNDSLAVQLEDSLEAAN
jgi:hypothetical protein